MPSALTSFYRLSHYTSSWYDKGDTHKYKRLLQRATSTWLSELLLCLCLLKNNQLKRILRPNTCILGWQILLPYKPTVGHFLRADGMELEKWDTLRLWGENPGGGGGRGRKGPRSTPSAGVGQSPRCTEQPSGQPLGSQCSCWGRDAHAEVCTRIDKQEGQSGRSEALGPLSRRLLIWV